MKFRRERKPSPWVVHDIYLRDTWGSPFNVSRSRRWNLRKIFLTAMIVFGIVDVCLVAAWFSGVFAPKNARTTAQRSPTRLVTAAARQPTVVARAVSPTPPPTAVPPTPAPPTVVATEPPPPVPTEAPPSPATAVPPGRLVSVDLPPRLGMPALSI